MFVRTLGLAALAATVAAALPASAAVVRAQEVAYSDLDLSNPKDAAQLDKRVDRAAKTVCYLDVVNDAKARKPAMACYKKTLLAAAEQVNAAKAAPGGKLVVRSVGE